jgi:hypothetical protein
MQSLVANGIQKWEPPTCRYRVTPGSLEAGTSVFKGKAWVQPVAAC